MDTITTDRQSKLEASSILYFYLEKYYSFTCFLRDDGAG